MQTLSDLHGESGIVVDEEENQQGPDDDMAWETIVDPESLTDPTAEEFTFTARDTFGSR